jgi:hypothetical protein
LVWTASIASLMSLCCCECEGDVNKSEEVGLVKASKLVGYVLAMLNP